MITYILQLKSTGKAAAKQNNITLAVKTQLYNQYGKNECNRSFVHAFFLVKLFHLHEITWTWLHFANLLRNPCLSFLRQLNQSSRFPKGSSRSRCSHLKKPNCALELSNSVLCEQTFQHVSTSKELLYSSWCRTPLYFCSCAVPWETEWNIGCLWGRKDGWISQTDEQLSEKQASNY